MFGKSHFFSIKTHNKNSIIKIAVLDCLIQFFLLSIRQNFHFKFLKMTNAFQVYNEYPLINIDNFEQAEFKDSKFVLTSPRSLLACEHLGIKVDLQ